MEQIFEENKIFEKENYLDTSLAKGEYENCKFISCDFSGSDLKEIKFSGCEFISCNLSLSKLLRTAFREIRFMDCKMLGMLFSDCNGIGLSFTFENCNLSDSSFFKTKIRETVFKNCKMHSVDFSESDLTSAVFDECDLLNAVFDNSVIEKADLRKAFNYSIDPQKNKIKKAMFSFPGVAGLLDDYDIKIEGA